MEVRAGLDFQDVRWSVGKDAIANGLLESARDNAEAILTGFFAQAYDLAAYSLEFAGA